MSSPYQSPVDYQPPQRRRVWPFVLGGCGCLTLVMLAACGGLLLLGWRQVSQDGDVAREVDRLFDAIAEQTTAEYYQRHCTEEFKKATSEQEFEQLAELIRDRLGKLQSKSVTGFSFNNRSFVNYVDANYRCVFEHGDAELQTKFKQTGDQWLLLSFNIDSPALVVKRDEAAATCPHCGKPYPAGAAFCPHCGAKIADAPPTEVEPDTEPVEPPPITASDDDAAAEGPQL